eukprot:1148810-Pelagomonas_calceolata.AAC.8
MAASSTNAVKQAPKSLHVGLDIGTYASGFAFSERAAPVRCHESWPDQPKPYPKTRSVILYKARHVKGRIQKQLHIGLTKGYPLQHVQIVDPFKEKRDVRMQLSGDNL